MLDQGDGSDLIARLWIATEIQAQLPEGEAEYFDLAGPLPMEFNNRRSYHRFYLRQRAVMKAGDTAYGVYARDISRLGIGILSPVQLLPLSKVRLLMPGGKSMNAKVTRCRRVAEQCYEIGAEFAASEAQVESAAESPKPTAVPQDAKV